MGKRRFSKNKRTGRKTEYLFVNNGELEYTYKEAEAKGITRPRFRNGIDQLVERGFIDITHQGSGGVRGDKSKYAISERWRNGSDSWTCIPTIRTVMSSVNRLRTPRTI